MRDSLGASTRLTRGRAPSTAGLTVGIVLGVALGPVVGTLILLGTDLPHYAAWLVNAAVMALATVWGGVALALALYSAEAAHQPEGLGAIWPRRPRGGTPVPPGAAAPAPVVVGIDERCLRWFASSSAPAIFFVSAFLGLLVADLVLPDLTMDPTSYLVAAVIFALVQGILSPLIFKVVHKNASAFSGGVGIISTLVALVITDLVVGGFDISGLSTWILAALIVWLAGAAAALCFPICSSSAPWAERRA